MPFAVEGRGFTWQKDVDGEADVEAKGGDKKKIVTQIKLVTLIAAVVVASNKQTVS